MASSLNKVQARVDTVVDDFGPIDAVLLFWKWIETGLNILHDRLPAIIREIMHQDDRRTKVRKTTSPVIIVDKVTESRGINNGQMQANAVLLDIYT